MLQNVIVWLIVGLSVGYLVWQGVKSLRGKGQRTLFRLREGINYVAKNVATAVRS